jgi:hypothetical protein
MFNNFFNSFATNNTTTNTTTKSFAERMREAHERGIRKGDEISEKLGYGMGYASTTVVEEAKYFASNVAEAVNNNSFVESFKEGYYNGKNDAYEAFVQRCEERERKARAKMDEEAAREAADELWDECDFEDNESVVGEEVTNTEYEESKCHTFDNVKILDKDGNVMYIEM